MDSVGESRGFIKVAPQGGGFVFENGEPFLPLGYSHVVLEHQDATELAANEAAGTTLVRIWPDAGETGAFDEAALDGWFELARRHDLYLLFSVVNPSRLSDLFADRSEFNDGLTCYNPACSRPEEAYTCEAAVAVTRRRLRWLIDRYGHSPRVFAWEIVNQGDAIYTSRDEELGAWLEETAAFVADYELRTTGRRHLRCASSYDPLPAAPVYYDCRELDLFAAHLYTRAVYDALDPVGAALEQHRVIRHVLSRLPVGRPYLDTEHGPISHFFDPGVPEPDGPTYIELTHNLLWSHFCSGGAGGGLPIPVALPGTPLPPGQLNHVAGHHIWPECARSMQALRRVADRVTLSDRRQRPLTGPVAPHDADLTVMARGDEEQALVWLLRDTRDQDVAGLLQRALAAGRTTDANRSLRLLACDSFHRHVGRLGYDLQSQYTRKAITVLLRRGLLDAAHQRLDEAMNKIAVLAETPPLRGHLGGVPHSRPARLRLARGGKDRCRVRWFDDCTGELLREEGGVAPQAELESPPFGRHMVMLIQTEG